ncbi:MULTISPECIES: hypothetical protein [Bradyrhizobium]|uniref:hypothetical protein n=1 Tax=Bradyrhizobium TaxID=374 RepID=UPI0011773EFA|nr:MULTISPECIES: hypothetical protein [Bradyrhizobium]MBR1329829.1 hypothetical protein [Bradyrhizobium ottawaense]MBR1335397.1 hypothetical protein [Bradyrhizobium ottawaense]MBR1364944.1 hypothetical protein [Bradyrhizobium ottawaense]
MEVERRYRPPVGVDFAVSCPSGEDGAALGVASPTLICSAASACLTRFTNNTQAVPGGNSSAAFQRLSGTSQLPASPLIE